MLILLSFPDSKGENSIDLSNCDDDVVLIVVDVFLVLDFDVELVVEYNKNDGILTSAKGTFTDSFNKTYNLALVATDSDVTEIVELDDEDESSAILQTAAVF